MSFKLALRHPLISLMRHFSYLTAGTMQTFDQTWSQDNLSTFMGRNTPVGKRSIQPHLPIHPLTPTLAIPSARGTYREMCCEVSGPHSGILRSIASSRFTSR